MLGSPIFGNFQMVLVLAGLLAFERVPFLALLRWAKGSSIALLGGSGVVISWVISPLIWVVSIVTLLTITHEPVGPRGFHEEVGRQPVVPVVLSAWASRSPNHASGLGFRV